MKILQVTPYYSPRTGGVENYVGMLSEALVERGHLVTVVTMAHERGLPYHEAIGHVQVKRFPKIGPTAYGMPIGLETYLLKVSRQFDIIHAHNYHALPFLITLMLSGSPVVITPHYHGHGHTALANLMHVFYTPLAVRAMKRACAVICSSTSEADLVAEKLGVERARIAVIPNIIGLTPSISPERRKQSVPNIWRLLSVGRLEAYKRVDRVIQALPYLPDHFHLTVIGVGSERARLDALVRERGLQHRVQFTGYVSDDELRYQYEQSDLVVTFSEAESFGRVIIEALQHQRRVVCSDIPAFRELSARFPDALTIITADTDAQEIAHVLQAACEQGPSGPINLDRYNAQRVAADVVQVYMRNSVRGSVSVSPNQGQVS